MLFRSSTQRSRNRTLLCKLLSSFLLKQVLIRKTLLTLLQSAVRVLTTADPAAKAEASHRAAEAWRSGALGLGTATPPDRPARPDRPLLLAPKEMPKRKAGGNEAKRVALL